MRGLDAPPAGQAIIGIDRHKSIKGLLRQYSVFIDSALVGRLWAFQSGHYPVSPGHHEICLRVGRRTMAVRPQVELDVGAGDVRSFRTGSKRLVLSWRSFLGRFPDWEEGPWITLKPWPSAPEMPGVARQDLPARPPARIDAARIDGVKFRRTLQGYKVGEVDQFLKDLATRVQAGVPVSAQELSVVTFHASLNGYDIHEVDAHIANLAKAFAR